MQDLPLPPGHELQADECIRPAPVHARGGWRILHQGIERVNPPRPGLDPHVARDDSVPPAAMFADDPRSASTSPDVFLLHYNVPVGSYFTSGPLKLWLKKSVSVLHRGAQEHQKQPAIMQIPARRRTCPEEGIFSGALVGCP